MKRFVLMQNIERHERALAAARDEAEIRILQQLLLVERRDLALLRSSMVGAVPFEIGTPAAQVDGAGRRRKRTIVQRLFISSRRPYLLIDPGPGLRIVAANQAYVEATMTSAADIAGRELFEVFPDNPDLVHADGVSNLFTSLQTAASTGEPHAMPIQRYDVRDGDGTFVTRYWQPRNTPIVDDDGALLYLLHHVEDVTAQVDPS